MGHSFKIIIIRPFVGGCFPLFEEVKAPLVKMELQCDICSFNFDLGNHRPKNLPCGHTICKACVENPALKRKCPTCRKSIGRNPHDLPDTFVVINLIEQNGAPPRKKPRTEDTTVQQLQRGVDAGRKVVEELRQVVPLAIEALNRQLESSVAQLRQMEEAMEQQVQQEAAGAEGAPLDFTEQLQVAAQLEHRFRLLSTYKCRVVAEEEAGAAWRASVQLGQRGGSGDILRLLLLQLQTDGQLAKADDVDGPATPASFVGPPLIGVISIDDTDLDNGRLKVNDILREHVCWREVRSIRGLKGEGSEQLLRLLAPQLEELEIEGGVTPRVMEEVRNMPTLKRLDVTCNRDVDDYPALPLKLEELEINWPCTNQLRCVERMSRLRSLSVWNYFGPEVTFTPSRHGALRWLDVCFDPDLKVTMLSLIRSCAPSLQELRVLCSASNEAGGEPWYFPNLGPDLATCGLLSLQRLVLERPLEGPSCTDLVAACLLQRQTLRSFFPSSVDIVCGTCNTPKV